MEYNRKFSTISNSYADFLLLSVDVMKQWSYLKYEPI